MMTFTASEASELCRMAQAAYRDGRNDIGHKASGINAGCQVDVAKYDRLMSCYRSWLVSGEFSEV